VATASAVKVRDRAPERTDLWWVEPVVIVAVLGAFVLYSMYAGLVGTNYYFEPYLSPLYSPCITANCVHPTLPIVGSYWNLSPAILIVAFPLAFRVTCYYYRRSYYRAFFWSPPACAVPDARVNYSGETKFPWIFQNIHRYALYLAIPVLAILWWDAIQAFNFDGHFGIGPGTLIMVANVLLLSGYTFGCHAARYLVGGYLDSFHGKSLRFRLWEFATKLNERHSRWAWLSLFGVALTDLYIRLLAMGVISEAGLRLIVK
jgi:hypothetical protein